MKIIKTTTFICSLLFLLCSCDKSTTVTKDKNKSQTTAPQPKASKSEISIHGVPAGTPLKTKLIGPGVGGSMFGAAFCPANPDIIVQGGDMGAAFRSGDSGKSWEALGGPSGNQPGAGGVWDVKFSDKNPDIVWIASSGAFKSVDTGKTWKYMGPGYKSLGAVAIDPTDPDIVYVAEGFSPRIVIKWVKGRVWKTTDGGASWTELPRPSGPLSKDSLAYRNYSTIVIDPNSKFIPGKGHQRIYIVGRGGLYRSDNGGETWKDLSKPFLPGATSDLVLITKDKKSILFAAIIPCNKPGAKGGIYKSVNNGETWEAANKGLEPLLKKLRTRNTNKKLIKDRNATTYPIMLGNASKNPNRLYLGHAYGIYRSDDMGKSWIKLTGEQDYIKDREGKYTSARKTDKVFKNAIFGGVCGMHRVAVSKSDPDRVIFTDMNDVYLSKDAGTTWEALGADFVKKFDDTLHKNYPPNRYTWSIKPRGYQNVVAEDIVVDPFNHKIYYAAYMDLGFQISRDGGVSWEHPSKGIPSRGHSWTAVVDPENKGLVFTTVGGGPLGGYKGGIYRSKDFGVSWEQVGTNETFKDQINDVVIDLHSPVTSRTMYLTTETKGIYKSTDTGTTWKRITASAGDDIQKTTALVLDPNKSGKIYLGTKKGLYISTDAGITWTLKSAGSFDGVHTVAVSKSNNKIIYVSAYLPGQKGYSGSKGYFRSSDGGNTWKNITPGFMKITGGIAVNPYDPDYIYGETARITKADPTQKSVIAKSKDGGKTWKTVDNGIAYSRGKYIIIDANNPQHLFILCRFGIIEAWDNEAPTK